MEVAQQLIDDWQKPLSHGSPALAELAPRQAGSLEPLMDVEVKEVHLGFRHARLGVGVRAHELHQRGFGQPGLQGRLRFPEHSHIVLVEQIVARGGDVDQALGQVGIQSGDAGGLGKRIRRPEPIGEEELHHRAEDLLFLLGARDGVERDLAPFEELDEANAFDVMSCEPAVRSGVNELERSKVVQTADRLARGSAELFSRQSMNGIGFHGASSRILP